MPKITLSIYEKALPPGFSWRQKLDAAAKAGYDEMELSVDEVSRLDMPYGLKTAIQGFIHDSGTRIGSLRLSATGGAVRPAVKFAESMGIRMIILPAPACDDEDLDKAAEYAASAGVMLALETAAMEKAMEYVARVGSPFIGVCPDIGAGRETAGEIEKGRGHIFSARLTFGEGRVDFKSACDKLVGLGVRRFTVNQSYDETRPECWEADISGTSTLIRGMRLGK